jgi:hypothetical protein
MVSRLGLVSDGFLVSPFRSLINYVILQRSSSLTTTPVIVVNALNKIWRATKRESWKKKPSNSDAEFLGWQKTITGNSNHANLQKAILKMHNYFPKWLQQRIAFLDVLQRVILTIERSWIEYER